MNKTQKDRRNQNNTEYFMIAALGEVHTERTIKSFLNSSNGYIRREEITIINEEERREHTLNKILKLRDRTKDCFIFVNDLIFEGSWLNDLGNISGLGDIVGFSMLEPKQI